MVAALPSPDVERRRGQRVRPDRDLTLDFIWSGAGADTGRGALPGTVVDVSREGLQVSVPYPLPIGMDVTFWLNLSEQDRCQLFGTIIWNAELAERVCEELPYRIGMAVRPPQHAGDREVWDRALAALGAS